MAKKSGSPPNREIAEVWSAMQNMETSHAQEKKRLLRMSEISLILDSYDDLFTQFDPRPYSERALSQDFLSEVNRGSRDKVAGYVELTLLVPSAIKDSNKEMIIEKRLKSHFEKHHSILQKQVWKVKKQGGIMVFIGTLLGTSVAIAHTILQPSFPGTFALVFLEPASWFLMWEGLGKIFEGWESYKPDLDFYKKMLNSRVSFLPY